MPNHPTNSDDARWLVEPGHGEAHIHVGIGEGAELTPELRAALEALVSALPQEEVAGYAKPEAGTNRICTQDVMRPCTQFATCRIGD